MIGTIAGTAACPRCRIVLIPTDGRLVCHGCTRDVAEVRPDDPETGFQRWCQRCAEWWPLTAEFWYVVRYERGEVCRSRGREYVRESAGATFQCRGCAGG